MSAGKDLYEALQAVNACLDETGEQLLVDLVEKIRSGLRRPVTDPDGPSRVETTLGHWIDFDAAEPAEPVEQPAWYDMRTVEEDAPSS